MCAARACSTIDTTCGSETTCAGSVTIVVTSSVRTDANVLSCGRRQGSEKEAIAIDVRELGVGARLDHETHVGGHRVGEPTELGGEHVAESRRVLDEVV